MSQKSVKNFAARWRLNPVIDLNSLQNLFCYELFCQSDIVLLNQIKKFNKINPKKFKL